MTLPRSCRFILPLLVCLGFFCLTASPLLAHHLPPGMEEVDEFDDNAAFMAGIRHTLLGADHWLFAVAVGVLAALGASRVTRIASATCFITGLLGGAAAGLQQVVLHPPHCALATGMFAVLIWPLIRSSRSALVLLLVAMFALGQGNDHGVAWPLDTGGGWYLAGLLFMAAALVAASAATTRLASSMIRVQLPARMATH